MATMLFNITKKSRGKQIHKYSLKCLIGKNETGVISFGQWTWTGLFQLSYIIIYYKTFSNYIFYEMSDVVFPPIRLCTRILLYIQKQYGHSGAFYLHANIH